MWRIWNSHTPDGSVKHYHYFEKHFGSFIIKHTPTIQPSHFVSKYLPKEMEVYVYTKICT